MTSSKNSIGIKLIAEGTDPKVDIIAIHGLHGDAYKTWTAKPESPGGKEVLWLRDLLPAEVPNARILAYGYDSDPGKIFESISTNTIYHHATTLVSELYFYRRREHERRRPVVFVCHSLGGIVVKRALIYSNSCNLSHNVHLRSVKVSTYGILFLGTPHMGADLARWGKMAEMLVRVVSPKAWIDSNSSLIKALEKNSETLQDITDNFLGISRDFRMFFCWEELKTSIPGMGRELIVDYSSAAPEALADAGRAAIHATHSDMSKFRDENSPGWNIVAGCIYDFVGQAPAVIERAWVQETRRTFQESHDYVTNFIQNTETRLSSPHLLLPGSRTPSPGSVRRNNTGESGFIQPDDISEVGDHYESPSTSQNLIKNTPFVKPLSLQENKYFEGGDDELKIIHSILTDPNKRAVSISGVAGGGKTHLAREYFFHRKSEFPRGAFWIDCKSMGSTLSTESLDLGYCMIAEELGLSNQQYHPDYNKSPKVDPKVTTRFEVNNWFDKHEGWLLVLDGAIAETSDEVNLLSLYVPKSKGGSIILTTLNSSFAGAARLGSPERLELGRIADDEAVRMVLHYGQINKPSETEVNAAKELVGHLGHNPLAIQSAGSYIKGKKVSVSDYLKKYEKRPFVEREFLEPFHIIFDRLDTRTDRYGEAGNLLCLIAFLHREIPVQMLEFGVRHLPPHIKLRAKDGSRRDLNNTIGHLLAYSLVDRIGKQSDNVQIDTLVLHNVVQEVCISRLRKRPGELRKWLELAILMYCASFDTMELRQNRTRFLVSDYRRYELHGVRLLEHANKHKLATGELEIVLQKLREAIKGDDQAEGPRFSMFTSASGSDSAPETPSPESPRHPTLEIKPGKTAKPTETGAVARLNELLHRKEEWKRIAYQDTSYDSDTEHHQPGKRSRRRHPPRPRAGDKPYNFRYEPPIPLYGNAPAYSRPLGSQLFTENVTHQYTSGSNNDSQSSVAGIEQNIPESSSRAYLKALLRTPTGFSSASQSIWPWSFSARSRSPPRSEPQPSGTAPGQGLQGSSTLPVPNTTPTPTRGRSPVRRGRESLPNIQFPTAQRPIPHGEDGPRESSYDNAFLDSTIADQDQLPFGGDGGPLKYPPQRIRTPIDYPGKGGILDIPYQPSNSEAVSQPRPFSPGFSPSRDLSSSPIARSIVGPRYDRPLSGTWSEPILDHEGDFSPRPSPYGSASMIRARSSAAAVEKKSPRIAQLQGLVPKSGTLLMGLQRSYSSEGRPLQKPSPHTMYKDVPEPWQNPITSSERSSPPPGLGIGGFRIPFGPPEVTIAQYTPDVVTSERHFVDWILGSEGDSEHDQAERPRSVPERDSDAESVDMQRSISEPVAGLSRRSPLRGNKIHND